MLGLQRLRPHHYRPFRQLCRRPAPALVSWYSIPSAHTVQVPTSHVGYRMLATSEGATKKRRPQISPTFKLRTLRPERLEAVGQEVIDLSGQLYPSVPTLDGTSLECAYERESPEGRDTRTPFPAGTKGVFYFHTPADEPELQAGVRFRLCERAPAFARGRDLLDTRGDVWGPKVVELVKRKELGAFLALCRAEQLVDEALLADLNGWDISKRVKQYHYHLDDPFELNLAKFKRRIIYVTRTKAVQLRFPKRAFRWRQVKYFPLTGSIKVQFELSKLPEHEEMGPTLVIRVLDIIEPISVHPRYNGALPVPVPGKLLRTNYRSWLKVLAIPLQRQPMAGDLLALAQMTWG